MDRSGLTAWGETFVQDDANHGRFTSSYRFNGKELDQEMGNYYYGARYYNPTWSVWLSVDAKAYWYPSMSSYNFTANNPVILVDPNGQWVGGEGFFTNLFYSDDRALEIKAQRFAHKVGGDLTKIDGGYRVGRVLGGDSKTNTLGEMEINSFYADHSSKVKAGNGQSGVSAEAPLFKYAGDQSKYPGAVVIETSFMSGGGVTLPPFVFTAPGGGSNQGLMRHEHGHILQYGALSVMSGGPITGYGLYLLGIGVPSIFSADKANNNSNHFHQGTYTEKSANQLEYWFQGMSTNGDHLRYPVYWK